MEGIRILESHSKLKNGNVSFFLGRNSYIFVKGIDMYMQFLFFKFDTLSWLLRQVIG